MKEYKVEEVVDILTKSLLDYNNVGENIEFNHEGDKFKWVCFTILKRYRILTESIVNLLPLLIKNSDYKYSIFLIYRSAMSDSLMYYYLNNFKDDIVSLDAELEVLDAEFCKNIINFYKITLEDKQLSEEQIEGYINVLKRSFENVLSKAPIYDFETLKREIRKPNSLRKKTNLPIVDIDKGKYEFVKKQLGNEKYKSWKEFTLESLYTNYIYFSQFQHFSPRSINFFGNDDFTKEISHFVDPIVVIINTSGFMLIELYGNNNKFENYLTKSSEHIKCLLTD